MRGSTPLWVSISQMNSKRKEWVNCLPPIVFRKTIEGFPYYTPFSVGNDIYGPGPILAYVLFMAGAKTFEFTHHWLGGDKSRPTNLKVSTNSIQVTPYIRCPLPQHKDTPLLWYLMRKSPWGFIGGGADEDGDYMQAGTKYSPYHDINSHLELYKAIVLFRHYVQHFPR